MSTLEPTPTATPPTASRGAGLAVTERRVLRSEWIKLRTVRSTVIGLVGAAAVLVVLGALFSAFANDDEDGPPAASGDSLTSSLGGMLLAQLVVGVLGVVFVGVEYSSGMIRVTLASVPSRVSILRAKAFVVAAVLFAVMGVASLAAFFVGNALYAGSDEKSLTDPGVLRGLLGAAVYAAGIGVLGVALGFLLRSTAAAISVLVALLLVVPVATELTPGAVGDWVSKVLPGNAGQAITHVTTQEGELSAWTGLAVFAAWLLALLVAAAVVLRRRDA